MSEWVEPVLMKYWGSLSVHAGQPNLSETGCWDPSRSDIPPIGPGELTVLWPDGHVGVVRIVMRGQVEYVSDMGHLERVLSMIPYIRLIWHGAGIEFPLHESGCKVLRYERRVSK